MSKEARILVICPKDQVEYIEGLIGTYYEGAKLRKLNPQSYVINVVDK